MNANPNFVISLFLSFLEEMSFIGLAKFFCKVKASSDVVYLLIVISSPVSLLIISFIDL